MVKANVSCICPSRAESAAQNFRQGYNCAQSVCLAFLDVLKLDRETVLKLSSSFGGGMGRLREVCGAVSAMFIIAGILKGYENPNDDTVKGCSLCADPTPCGGI